MRTLRPEYVREAFTRYKITYVTLVPLVLKNLERGLRERFAELPPAQTQDFRMRWSPTNRISRARSTERRP